MNTLHAVPLSPESKIHETLHFVFGLAKEGLPEIIAATNMALLALESPKALSRPEDLAHVLSLIGFRAENLLSCITEEALQLEMDEADPAATRRIEAAFSARGV